MSSITPDLSWLNPKPPSDLSTPPPNYTVTLADINTAANALKAEVESAPIHSSEADALAIWELNPNLNLIQEGAKFYYFKAVEEKFSSNPEFLIQKELETGYLLRQFRNYLDAALGGELRHVNGVVNGCLSEYIHFNRGGNRWRAWVEWKKVRDTHGIKALEEAVEYYKQGRYRFASGYGGRRWQLITEFLLWLLEEKITPDMFVDCAFGVQHNCNLVFNKLWSVNGLNHFLNKVRYEKAPPEWLLPLTGWSDTKWK